MKKVFFFFITVSIIAILVILLNLSKERRIEESMTERFIKNWMMNDNGTLATYLLEGDTLDTDLVKGREALSESLGLWLKYALEKEDKQLFDDAYQLLLRFFLENDGYVHWKLNETGDSEVTTNALIDDLRIIHALFQASEKWDQNQYKQTAIKISKYVNQYNEKKYILTDYYNRRYEYTSDKITLSYIDPSALTEMLKYDVLNKQTYETTLSIIKNIPQDQEFYPKAFDVQQQDYLFEEDINLVDQTLVALNLSQIGIVAEPFLEFIKDEVKQNGVIFGKYNRKTKMPAVTYESPAIYGLLILYCLEIGEEDWASILYERMVTLRNNHDQHPYYGSYSMDTKGDTHIFDNLLPLLAETISFRHISGIASRSEKYFN